MAEPVISFAWLGDVFKFVENPVPGQPVLKPMTTALPAHPCEKCNIEMKLAGSRVHSGNRMVQNTWTCPKCGHSYIEDGLVRMVS